MERAADDGFSLVEAVMASFVVVLLFAGFGKSMSAAFDGSHDNVAALEATALAVEQTEFVRSLEWGEIALPYAPDQAPMVDEETGRVRADEANLDHDEDLYVDPAGLVHPMATEVVDRVTYTVRSYVTVADGGLRRLIVLVTWEADGVVSMYKTSTLISEVSTR